MASRRPAVNGAAFSDPWPSWRRHAILDVTSRFLLCKCVVTGLSVSRSSLSYPIRGDTAPLTQPLKTCTCSQAFSKLQRNRFPWAPFTQYPLSNHRRLCLHTHASLCSLPLDLALQCASCDLPNLKYEDE